MTYLVEEPSEGRKYLVRADTPDDAVKLWIDYIGDNLNDYRHSYGEFVVTSLSELLSEDKPVSEL